MSYLNTCLVPQTYPPTSYTITHCLLTKTSIGSLPQWRWRRRRRQACAHAFARARAHRVRTTDNGV